LPPGVLDMRAPQRSLDDVVDDVCVHTTQQGEGRGTTTSTPAREALLAGWLRDNLGFVGTARFVREHGPRVILDTLYEMGEWHDPLRIGQAKWRIKPIFKNPAGMLRWLIGQGAAAGEKEESMGRRQSKARIG